MSETTSPPRIAPADRKLSLATKLFYGLGSVAFGVKDNEFSYLLLIFYNQVVGLPGDTGWRRADDHADLGRLHRSGDRPALRQPAQPLGPAPSLHVRGRASGG